MANDNLTSSNAAVHRVFAILELSESIFFYLTPNDLLAAAQQVCKQWYDTIRDSIALQELLFLRPIAGISPCYHDMMGTWRDFDTNKKVSLVENPFAILLCHPDPPDSFQLPTASWRRMLLTQPPVRVACFCSRTDWADLRSAVRPDGIRLDDLATPVHGITGSSGWLAFQDHGQLQAIKAESKLSDSDSDSDAIDYEDDEVEWNDWLAEKRWMCSSSWSGCA